MDTVVVVLQAILALVFLGAGGSKLAGAQMQVANFQRYGYPQWFRLVTGAVEVIGAAGMAAGIWVEDLAIAAAVLLAVTMVGAVYTDARHSPPAMVIPPLVLLVLSVAVLVLRLA